jgi:hypothetical protein
MEDQERLRAPRSGVGVARSRLRSLARAPSMPEMRGSGDGHAPTTPGPLTMGEP